ncbi:MAG: tail fiber domain-containing protein [Bacteroidota bacterium]
MLILALISQPAIAQIELDNSGNVGIKDASPGTSQTLNLQGTNATGIKIVTSHSGPFSYGLNSQISSGATNYGVWSRAQNGSSANYGIYAEGKGGSGTFSFGVRGNGRGGNTAYGVYGEVTGTATTEWAGFFAGKIYGDCCMWSSDEKLKEDIVGLDGASIVQKLMLLRPTSYSYKQTEEFSALNLGKGMQYGLIAQEVEEVFPEFIEDVTQPASIDENGNDMGKPMTFKGMNYNALIPLLLAAIQEQQAEIDALKTALQSNGILVDR